MREDATWAVRGVWHGSGFLVRELPEAHRYHEDEARHCASCQSEDTLCIYLLADPGQFSITIEIELVCKACSAYTLWEGSD